MTNFINQKSDPIRDSAPVKVVGAYSPARWAGPWLFISGPNPLRFQNRTACDQGYKGTNKKSNGKYTSNIK